MPRATRVVLGGGEVFDGTGAAPEPADVAVADGRVVDVGTGLDGDERVDVSGCTLTPGFFDCHVHVVLDAVDAFKAVQLPFSYQFFVAVRNLSRLLDCGITTARDAWGADLGVRRALDDRLVPGPRLQISITMISQTGGHGDDWMPCGRPLSIFSAPHPGRPSGVADGPEGVRRIAREVLRAGADFLKVATSGGVLSPQSDPRHGHFRDDELAVLAAEAAAAGVPLVAHAQASAGVKAAVRAGARSIEHGVFLDDESVTLLVERGAWLVPTLTAPFALLDAIEAGVAMPAAVVRKTTEVVEAHVESFRRAVDAGVRVAMGTDSPVAPFGDNLRELALMVEHSSMTAWDALASATSSAAGLLHLDGGVVAPGARADLVVLRGSVARDDDLKDLGQRVEQVWQEGLRIR